jgi:hypothetical protein
MRSTVPHVLSQLSGLARVTRPAMAAVAALTLALAPAAAMAQDEEDGREIRYKERTEIDFEGVEVDGELLKPDGALLLDMKRSQFNPLIRLRTDFNAEMKASVEEVK